MRNKSIHIAFVVITVLANFALADCPSADLNGDCFVDFEDFALMANQLPTGYDYNDLADMANQWLTTDPCVPNDMDYIPDGEFEMGDHLGDGSSHELPIHTVMLDSFFMGKYEVTNAQYCQYLNSALGSSIYVSGGVVCGSGNHQPYCDTSSSSSYSQISYSGGIFTVSSKGGRDMSNDPMVKVSWYGSVDYCNWRSQQEGKEQCYNLSTWACDFNKKGYRLATEAEWEYAARGGLSSRRFPWGDTITHNQANYYSSGSYSYDVSPTSGFHPLYNDGIFPYTAPVGSFKANGHGLYDMSGNVWEWCNDWYDSDYYDTSPYDNPTGPLGGKFCVLRGGDWYNNERFCRLATRGFDLPDYRFINAGFRVVLDLN